MEIIIELVKAANLFHKSIKQKYRTAIQQPTLHCSHSPYRLSKIRCYMENNRENGPIRIIFKFPQSRLNTNKQMQASGQKDGQA